MEKRKGQLRLSKIEVRVKNENISFSNVYLCIIDLSLKQLNYKF